MALVRVRPAGTLLPRTGQAVKFLKDFHPKGPVHLVSIGSAGKISAK